MTTGYSVYMITSGGTATTSFFSGEEVGTFSGEMFSFTGENVTLFLGGESCYFCIFFA